MLEPTYKINIDSLEVKMICTYPAQREAVWRTFTDPVLIPQWWGPAEYTTVIEKIDVTPGGAWRFIQYDKDGHAHPFSGTYLTVEKPRLLQYTFRYEPYTPSVSHTDTIELTEISPQETKAVTVSTFATLEDLELLTKDGMNEGATAGYKRQIQLLQTMKEGK